MKGRIPQGRTLGPLACFNDLHSRVTNGLLLQYADDTTLIMLWTY